MIAFDIFAVFDQIGMMGIGNHICLNPVNDLDIAAAFYNVATGFSRFGEGVHHTVVGNGNGGMPAVISFHHQIFGGRHTVHFRHIGMQMQFYPFFEGIVKHLDLLQRGDGKGVKNIFFGIFVIIDLAEHHHAGAFFDLIFKNAVLRTGLFGGDFGSIRSCLVGEHKGKPTGATVTGVSAVYAEDFAPNAGSTVIGRHFLDGLGIFRHPIAVDELSRFGIIR